MTRTALPFRSRLRRAVSAATALVVAVGLGTAACTKSPSTATTYRAATSASASIALSTSPPSAGPADDSAAARLRALADRLAPAPGDTHTGDYTYIHTQMWARSSRKVARIDTRTWRHANGSGVIITRTLPERDNLLRLPDGKDRDQFTSAKPATDTYAAGQLAPDLREPITTDPTTLAAQLYINQPKENGPVSLLRGLLDLNGTHYLDRQVRATALRLLATIPTLRYDGPSTDIAGRTAIGYSLDTGSSHEQLLIHPTTGEFLAHQETVNTSPPALFVYDLYLDRDRRTSADPA